MKLNLLSKLAIAGAVGVAALCAPMKAEAAYFKLDDFDVDLRRSVQDASMDPMVFEVETDVSKTVIGGTIWPEDWDRTELAINNIAGDPGEAILCNNCGAFEMISSAGASENIAWVDYAGPAFDLSVYNGWMPLYSADIAGGDLRLLTDTDNDGTFETVLAQAVDLPSTGGAGPTFLDTLMLPWETMNLTVDDLRVQIDGTGVPNLDFTVDHVKTPEPGTILGLLAVGGLGFGLKRKKQS